MDGDISISVELLPDENGMVGRQCPDPTCNKYFKVKPGTGLPVTVRICPYCSKTGGNSEFLTDDQQEYVKSLMSKQFIDPLLHDFKRDIESLNRPSSSSFFQLEFSVNISETTIYNYEEKDLETTVTCDFCGLVFCIYGVFASCPDCGKLNDFQVFISNMTLSRKKLKLVTDAGTISDQGLCDSIKKDALTNAISSFDALGKKLRDRFPSFAKNPRNLFQNITELDKSLMMYSGQNIEMRVGLAAKDHLFLMFQVRHIYEHNLGVVDRDFIVKVPSQNVLLGRKYPLSITDIEQFFNELEQLAMSIKSWIIP